MSFVNGDFQEAIDYPNEECPGRLGGLLAAFPPAPLLTHERGGFRFQPPPCGEVLALDPDFCFSAVKMDPNSWRPERDALVGAVQSAVTCSFGVSDADLRREAQEAIDHNLSRAIEADLLALLAGEAAVQPGTHQAVCALSEAAQFLATSSECGTGIIFGPTVWFTELGKDNLIWNGKYHTDVNGNIVIPHFLDNNTLYAFDGGLILKASEIMLLDEHMPGQRERNDRVVRAELLYAIAIAPCAIAQFALASCCPCGGGEGGGVTDVNVVSAVPLNVTVSNFPESEFSQTTDDECLSDDNGVFFRRTINDGEGNVTITTVDVAGNPYVPVGEIVPCDTPCCPINIGDGCWSTGSASGQWTALRLPDETIRIIDPATGLDVDPSDIVACPGESLDGIVSVDDECMTDDNGVFFRRTTVNGAGQITVENVDIVGNGYAPVGTVQPCGEPVTVLDSTVQRVTGAGNIVIAAGARSVTVTVLNTATAPTTINLGQGVTSIPAGVSLTWAADGRNESLNEGFTFSGVAGSDFIVNSTREV